MSVGVERSARHSGLGEWKAPERIRVAVRAPDPITLAGLTSSLGGRREVLVVPGEKTAEADVLLVAADRVTPEVLAMSRGFADETDGPTVLVTGGMDKANLLSAIECRVVAVLPRAIATRERLIASIRSAAAGDGILPQDLLGELLRQVERLNREVLRPRGWSLSSLTPREVDVLRLLADGWDTVKIAGMLGYSDRTVKNVIHGLTNRLNLRNRAHAVAFALRAGLI